MVVVFCEGGRGGCVLWRRQGGGGRREVVEVLRMVVMHERGSLQKNALLPTDFSTKNKQISVGNDNSRSIFRRTPSVGEMLVRTNSSTKTKSIGNFRRNFRSEISDGKFRRKFGS